jgi:hypothetical protein
MKAKILRLHILCKHFKQFVFINYANIQAKKNKEHIIPCLSDTNQKYLVIHRSIIQIYHQKF